VYRVVVYPEAADQLAELPASVLAEYARVIDAIEVAPWNASAVQRAQCRGRGTPLAVRPEWCRSGALLVLDQQREVHVLRVLWVELD
jgi:hypothetical protein